MDTTWSTGELADAHRVTNVLKHKFGREEKRASREFVADYFRSVGARSVLDLWGGGESAAMLRAVLPLARVVSCENGSIGKKVRVSDLRLRRAHRVAADEGGYEAAWGDVSEYLPQKFDAVWLDFCAQWHPTMAKLVELAGRHTNHLAVTLMPERDGFGALGYHHRILALSAVIAGVADMVPAYVGSYRRNDLNQDMALLIFDRRSASGDGFEATSVLPTHILGGLSTRGAWASRRFTNRGSMRLLKCSKCGDSFTYRRSEEASGSTRRKTCDQCVWRRTHRHTGSPCQTCGRAIDAPHRQKYCSDECQPSRPLAQRGPCQVCGGAVLAPRRTICSAVCEAERSHRSDHHKYWSVRQIKRLVCGRGGCDNEFDRTRFGQRKFCSTRCRKIGEAERDRLSHQRRRALSQNRAAA